MILDFRTGYSDFKKIIFNPKNNFQFPIYILISFNKFALHFKNLKKEIIVITGGPGTGKTTIIDAFIEQGYACFPEISRQITLEAKKEGIEQLFLERPLLFSELLFFKPNLY